MKKILDWLMNKPVNTYLVVSYSLTLDGISVEGNMYIKSVRPTRDSLFIDCGLIIESVHTDTYLLGKLGPGVADAAVIIHSIGTVSEEWYNKQNNKGDILR